MSTDELDRRVVDGLRALADEAEPSDVLRARSLDAEVRRRPVRRRWLPAAAALVAVALIGVALAAVGDDGADDVAITTAAETAVSDADVVVRRFLDALRRSDLDAAVELVDPNLPDPYDWDDTDAVRRSVEIWEEGFAQLIGTDDLDYLTTKSFGWTPASTYDIVTVISPRVIDGARETIAFVVGPSLGSELDSDPPNLIQQLGSSGLSSSPPPGSPVAPGDRLIVREMPLEGGATAHIDGRETEVVVDSESMTTTVEVPAWVSGADEFVLTMSFASPELPSASAVSFRVHEIPEGAGIGDARLDHAFTRDGQLWAATVEGDIPLGSQGGFGSASPDGKTIAYTQNCSCPFWEEWTVDATSGRPRKLSAWGQRWSPDGTMRAGIVPIDDEVPTTISIVDVENDAEMHQISLGVGPTAYSLTWIDNDHLLVVPWRDLGQGARQEGWLVDIETQTRRALRIEDAGNLVVAEIARPDGSVAGVRIRDAVAEWGVLRVHDDRATFEQAAVLPASSDGHDLATAELYVDARSGSDRYLLGDGKELFEINEQGELVHLRSDVEWATAP